MRKTRLFSKPSAEQTFVNKFDKVSLLILAAMIVICALIGSFDWFKGSIITFLIVFPFILIFIHHFNKFAHKISFDLDTREVNFHMFRNKGVITAKIDDIENVKDKPQTIFSLKDGRTIQWNKESGELVRLLKELGVRVS